MIFTRTFFCLDYVIIIMNCVSVSTRIIAAVTVEALTFFKNDGGPHGAPPVKVVVGAEGPTATKCFGGLLRPQKNRPCKKQN